MHKIEILPEIPARWAMGSGRKSIFGDIDPQKTAHIVVDMQNGFLEPGATIEIPTAREIVPNVNRISRMIREVGGINIFLRFTVDQESLVNWSTLYRRLYDEAMTAKMIKTFSRGCHGHEIHPDIEVGEGELTLDKTRFGAFVPGTSKLPNVLQEKGIDTLIITGTATNGCCESTAREAMQLNYKVIFVANANAAITDTEHNSALNSLSTVFTEVITCDQLIQRLSTLEKGIRSAVDHA